MGHGGRMSAFVHFIAGVRTTRSNVFQALHNRFELRPSAAAALRDGRSMRARLRMSKKGADLVRSLRRKDVLEFAGLLFNLALALQCETVRKQPLGKAVAPNDIGGPLPTALGQLHD